MLIQENPIWAIVDSTKLMTYMSCPRKYFFEYILGWRQIEPSIHLEFGIAWHFAMEHMLLSNDYGNETVMTAYQKFLTHYRSFWGPAYDEENAPKCPENTMRGLLQYSELYYDDKENFKVINTEIAGTVMLGDTRQIYFRMDSINEGDLGYFSLEHKTGSNPNRVWCDQWRQSTQVGTYLHVMNCLYDPDKVSGVILNGFFPSNPPGVKKDGSLKANARDNQFLRLPQRRSLKQMNDWFVTTDSWMSDLIRDTEMILKMTGNEPCMIPFRKDTQYCTQYFGCPYSTICQAWPNPLAEAFYIVQPGYKQEFWDPRPAELGGEGLPAKQIINL